ncbi:MAG: PQQ-binding-like beta-propeller repeat protein [Elusimicrobiota bacterium]|nr:MAG: PQQ-binding-like beta-propeller repeat protein [Elusimicrobiota bacterium]
MRALLSALLLAAAALPAAAAGPANSPWPMARRDPQKSSSATFAGAAPSGFHKLQHWWSVTLAGTGGGAAIGDSVSLDENGNAYATSGDSIYALSKSSGGLIWRSTLPAGNFTQPAITDTGLVITSSANAVVAFSSATGQHQWTYRPVGVTVIDLAGTTAAGQIFDGDAHPVITPGGQVLAAPYGENGSASGQRRPMVALDFNGVLQWGILKGGGFNTSLHPPAVSTSGAEVYFGTSDSGFLYGRFAASGGAFASMSDGFSDADAAKVSVGPAGDVFHFTNSGGKRLERRNRDLSVSVWVTTRTFSNRLWTPAISGSSVIYVTADGRLYGFRYSDGAEIVTLDMNVDDTYSLGPPTVVSSDTVLFVGQRNFNTHLYNVDPLTQSLRWRYTLNSGSMANLPQVTVSTHAILVHTLTGTTHRVHSFFKGTYTGVSISSTPLTRLGATSQMISTITVTATDAGANPVPGAPIQMASALSGSLGFTLTPLQAEDGLGFSTTAANGQVRYVATFDFSTWDASVAPVSSTLTVTALGLAPATIQLQNTSASTFTVTVSTPRSRISETRFCA